MPPAQTQSLPAWTPAHSVACKPAFEDEDPLYLSGEETDCDSERGSDTLSREDQQLMASFIQLQRQRALKKASHQVARPAVARTTPVLIPSQTRKYVATSTKEWLWDHDDEEDDDCNQYPCSTHHSSQRRPAAVEPAKEADPNDLIFDLEL